MEKHCALLPVKLFLIYSLEAEVLQIKPAHVVASIKQSPVLKGHPFLALS